PEKSLVPARDDVTHAGDPDEIDADAERHWPIWARSTPASSSAIAWIRVASAPAIMTRASAAVAEWRVSTRAAPSISFSNDPTRSPRPWMDSIGGLLRTRTLTST